MIPRKKRIQFDILALKLLPPILINPIKYTLGKTVQQKLQQYLRNGQVPWSVGYDIYKTHLLTQTLRDEQLLNCFATGDFLPSGYGYGVDERCIEYPWLLANLPTNVRSLLDAGSVFNYQFILDLPILKAKKIHILTLAPEKQCFWERGVSYLYEDLRNIPIKNDYYDAIASISTLEHIGCDNTFYTQKEDDREYQLEDFIVVMQEMRRVLKSDGSLFLSVPFGIYRHFGTFQQFDRSLLFRAIEAFGEAKQVKETFYRYTCQGWQISTAQECANCEYVEWITTWQHQQKFNHIPVEPDLAAAARAVACIQLIKT